MAGMMHKLFYNFDLVIYLYGLNSCMVFMDIILYFRNKKITS